ncbi:hypothetical protein NXW27_00460 [Phocaeicola dorei]|nr:hypothetical protein [Phocaeicola dorei]
MRIKNVPREYMRNYSIEGVKAPRSQTLLKHTPWIVFANEAGTSYLSPSGKNEMQSVKYMDAFRHQAKRRLAQSHSIRPSHSEKRETERMETGKIMRMDQPKRPVADPSGFTDIVTGFKNKQVSC